ncbi:hypothetical protein ACWD0A_02855 [Streptomyces sp. NPDC002867]
MSNAPVDPAEIPVFTGSLEELDKAVKDLSGDGAEIVTAAGDVHTTFGGLRAFYQAPEAEQLFAVTQPVKDKAATLSSDLGTVAGALGTYASDIRPLVQQLKDLKREAEAFRTKVADDDKWREDGDLIEENLERRNKIAEVWTQFQEAERACHNKIVALVNGDPLKVNDGSNGEGMYGYDAEALKQAKSLPWGDAVEESTPWWQVWEHAGDFVEGFFVDGVWGTVKGLGTLVGFDGWDAAGQAWVGLGKLATGLALSLSPGTAIWLWTADEKDLPSWIRDSRTAMKETGKALLAWDQWDAHPGRAAGAVTFNVLTTVFTGGTGGAVAGAGKAGAAAKVLSVAGKAGRALDPTTYIFKGAGAGLSKISDVMAGLKGMGKIEFPPIPEGAIALPEGSFKLPDGTLHLPEGAAVPEGAFEVPAGTVRLPEGTPIPAGAVDFGDGMVKLPEGTPAPTGSLPVPEGAIKVPEGTTALPEGTAKVTDPFDGSVSYFDKDGNLLAADGTVKQTVEQAHKEGSPAVSNPTSGADNPPVRTPAEVPAMAGVGARGGDDGVRLGSDLGDVGRVGDEAPGGGAFDRTPGGGANNLPTGQAGNNLPGGGAGNNLPTNSLDNGVGGAGRSGDTTPTTGSGGTPPGGNLGDNAVPGPRTETPGTAGAGRDVPGGSTADNGVPGGPAPDNGAGGGSGHAETPGAGGVDDAARSAEDAAHRAEYEAAREKPADERTPAERAAITREHVRLANEDPVWRAEHYDKWGPGKRNDAEEMVDGQLLPKLVEKPGGGWMAADDLPYANPEQYHVNPMNRGRDTVTPDNLNHLDEVSGNRVAGMDLAAAEKAYKANPTDETAKALADAQEHFNKTVGEGVSNNTKLGEALGEEAARRHMLLQKEFEGAREITDLPDTPNGSKRFDQLWRDKDGNLIIVEAKGPNGTLDWRQGNGARDSGTMVKQGTIEYVRTILADMDERALTSPKDAKYAKEIRAAIKNKTLRYVLVQAVENNGKYAGAGLKHFKIF